MSAACFSSDCPAASVSGADVPQVSRADLAHSLDRVIARRANLPAAAEFSWEDTARLMVALEGGDVDCVVRTWKFVGPYVREACGSRFQYTPLDHSDALSILGRVVRTPGVPSEVLLEAWGCLDLDRSGLSDLLRLRVYIVEHANCPPAVLVDVLHGWAHQHTLVSEAVKHPNLPPSASRRILDIAEGWVFREWLASPHPSPSDVAEAYERGAAVWDVASNPNAPASVLERAAADVVAWGSESADPVEVDSYRYAARLISHHPNASPTARLSAIFGWEVPLSEIKAKVACWSEEQTRLASDLADGWKGSFSEFCAAVES